MRRIRPLLLALAALAALAPGLAGACAALFSPEEDVRQTGQRIIFAVDSAAQTVEAYVAVSYVGAAEDFAWIVPLPSEPEVGLARAEAFAALDDATTPRFLLPPNPCPARDGGEGAVPGAAGGGVDVLQQGRVGPYDFSVVGGESGGELAGWLRQNGYRVTAPMEPLIQSYADAGMLFLAMKLSGGQSVGDIEPVKLTFRAAAAMVPLRLAAVGAEPGTELRVWVFADRQVAPQNLERLTIPDELVGVASFGGGHNYRELADAALAQAAGRGMITEAALPTATLTGADDPLIDELRGRFAYVTRLFGRFDPEQMTVDPVFAPAGGLEDIPVTRDLRARVSPYRCSERDVIPLSQQATPAGSAGGLWLTYGWLAAPLGLLVALAAAGAWALGAARRR